MAGPFPGMDPYLEARDLWADVHSMLVPRLRVQIAGRLPEGYLVQTQERLVVWPEDGGDEVAAMPDVAIVRARSTESICSGSFIVTGRTRSSRWSCSDTPTIWPARNAISRSEGRS